MTISFTTPAILLKRIDFGDDDLILTVLSPTSGKISLMAKSAKKSRKRFCGALDLFSVSNLVYTTGKGRLPILQEAAVKQPFSQIRTHFGKTAYACYFAEIVNNWMEPDTAQPQIFELLIEVLHKLDKSDLPDDMLSIAFQMALMIVSGFSPNLSTCCDCHTDMENLKEYLIGISFPKGGLLCSSCNTTGLPVMHLSRGTIKQLQWMGCGCWNKIARARLSRQSIEESLGFLEAFVPYHLGKEPKSLSVLRQYRNERKME